MRVDSGLFWAVFGGLALFGLGYNAFVAWAERRGYTEGYMSLIVACGVLVTLGGVAILSVPAALTALAAFVASGTPMIIGSIVRYVQRRAAERERILAEVRHGNAAQTVAEQR